jgi:predicted CXXCH cytochrome family protein
LDRVYDSFLRETHGPLPVASCQRGAVLLTVLLTMVIFSILGASMLSTTATSTLNQVYANQAMKAYYLAESGCRYAASNLRTSPVDCITCHSSDSGTTIETKPEPVGGLSDDSIKMHGKTYKLTGGGEFQIFLAPFWFKAKSGDLDTGDKTLTVHAIASSDGNDKLDFPEQFKTEESPSPSEDGGHLRVSEGAGAQYIKYTSITDNGDGTLTFNSISVDEGELSELGSTVDIFPACLVKNDQVLAEGGDLEVKNIPQGTLYAFPDAKSRIQIKATEDDGEGGEQEVIYRLTYKHAVVEGGSAWKLTGLRRLSAKDPFPASVKDKDIVTLYKCIRIRSTGAISETSRTLEQYEWISPSGPPYDPITVPIVYNKEAPVGPLAGGNFYWVSQAGGDARGHNVLGISGKDGALEEAPGRGMRGLCGLDCHETLAEKQDVKPSLGSGCEGCHLFVPETHHTDYGGYGNGSKYVYEDPWYRFLPDCSVLDLGVEGIEHDKWNYDAGAGSHNEYLGKPDVWMNHGPWIDFTLLGNTMTAFCCGCHPVFHKENEEVDGSGYWHRHPSDHVIPNSGEYASAFGASGGTGTFDPELPVARPSGFNWSGGPSSSVTLGRDAVMCLSCHAPHGSEYPDMLRWDYDEMIVGTSGAGHGKGCFKCHTDKDNPAYYVAPGQHCHDCHTMHNSQDGQAVVGPGNAYPHLLNNYGEGIRLAGTCPHVAGP